VFVVAFALFNDMIQLTMLTPIVPSLIASPPPLGVRENAEMAMGLLFACKDIFQLAVAPLAGHLATRYSSQMALFISTVGLGIATLSFAQAKTFWHLLFARSCQGAASAATMSGGMSLIAETHSEKGRGAAMGVAYTGLAVGVLCGPLIGGLLFDRIGRRRTFEVAGLVVLANAVVQAVLMLVTANAQAPQQVAEDKQGSKQRESKPKPHRDAGEVSSVNSVGAYRQLLGNGKVLALVWASVAINAVLGLLKPISQVCAFRFLCGVGFWVEA
jgi:DHA1 family solute carrier family 18 vesicular amine transporter 1/2